MKFTKLTVMAISCSAQAAPDSLPITLPSFAQSGGIKPSAPIPDFPAIDTTLESASVDNPEESPAVVVTKSVADAIETLNTTPTTCSNDVAPTPNPTSYENVIITSSALSDAIFGLSIFLTFVAIIC